MSLSPLRYQFLLLVLLNASCAQDLTPRDVAVRFWNAIEQGDTRAVKHYVTAADAAALESLDRVLPITKSELKRTVIEDESAFVDTTVTVDGDKPLDFPLRTYLVREDQRWKVDYERTISAVATAGKLAAVIDKVHEFGDTLQQGIDRSVEQLEQTLPEIERELSRIEDQIKQQVPELRKRLENFTRELKDALENPPRQKEDPAPEPGGSVAI
jgi:hypothetical protein